MNLSKANPALVTTPTVPASSPWRLIGRAAITETREFGRQRRSTLSGSAEPRDEGTRLLEEDMERYSQRESQSSQPAQQREDQKQEGGIKSLLDKFLIGDFFFVVLALGWLALGVAEQGTLKSSKLLDVWFPLWALVFQPAIGILMLGALVSGGLGWLKSQQK